MNEQTAMAIGTANDLLQLQRRLREDAALGLIYEAYVHNCKLHSGIAGGGTAGHCSFGREALLAQWLAELHSFGEQRLTNARAFGGLGTTSTNQSQLVMSRAQVDARHTGEGLFGAASNRELHYQTLSASVVANGRILEEWHFTDNLHIAMQLGVAPAQMGKQVAAQQNQRNLPCWNLGEVASARGQSGPLPYEQGENQEYNLLASASPLPGNWINAINFRRFDMLASLYQKEARVYAPGGRQLAGPRALARFWLSLITALPDSKLELQLLAGDSPTEQLGMVWCLCGRHTGPGLTAVPSGAKLNLQGMTQWQLGDGKILGEWLLFDELDLLAQIHAYNPQAQNSL